MHIGDDMTSTLEGKVALVIGAGAIKPGEVSNGYAQANASSGTSTLARHGRRGS